MEFIRSGPAPKEGCEFGPREQLSQVTSYLDASMVYSSNAMQSDSLRIFRNGEFKRFSSIISERGRGRGGAIFPFFFREGFPFNRHFSQNTDFRLAAIRQDSIATTHATETLRVRSVQTRIPVDGVLPRRRRTSQRAARPHVSAHRPPAIAQQNSYGTVGPELPLERRETFSGDSKDRRRCGSAHNLSRISTDHSW